MTIVTKITIIKIAITATTIITITIIINVGLLDYHLSGRFL